MQADGQNVFPSFFLVIGRYRMEYWNIYTCITLHHTEQFGLKGIFKKGPLKFI